MPLIRAALTLALTTLPAWADSHNHSHSTPAPAAQIAKGYFDDAQIQARSLSDWQGRWQSVYPYLRDGSLDAVMAHKAESGDKSAEEYRAYYETGYQTDVNHIDIAGDRVTFTRATGQVSATYAADGFEVLTYQKGNRGVRFVFVKTAGDAAAPSVIQFSDHIIAPEPSQHFHLYWGENRTALLGELDHWPTYYPAGLSGAQIVEEMLAH